MMKKTVTCLSLSCLSLLLNLPSSTHAEDAAPEQSTPPFSVKVTGSGLPMILIPGLSCGGNVWDGTVAHFKDHYECHVFTLAGFAGQPAIGKPFLPRVRTALEKYIREKHLDHPVIIGHSLGGFMAFWLASDIPNEVGPVIAVDGLPFLPAIFSPIASAENSKPFAESYRAQYDSQNKEQFMAALRTALAGMITDQKDLDAVDSLGKQSDPKSVGQAFYELMTTDARPLVKAITSPVLLIGATSTVEDPQQRNAVESAYRLQVEPIPNHKVVFAPRAKHFIQLDSPEFFYAQVESFLRESRAHEQK